MNYKIVSVDFQNDFSLPGGISHKNRPRPSVDFTRETLFPFLRQRGLKIAEIISDYRPPRPGDRGDLCHPGEWGYESIIPADVKNDNIWIKCMNSPVWVRENIGETAKTPGLPYQDPESFNKWLLETVGRPEDTEVVLIGLTADCCVMCTGQELNWRGYKVHVLKEASDTDSGDQAEKEYILNNPPARNWVFPISWDELKAIL